MLHYYSCFVLIILLIIVLYLGSRETLISGGPPELILYMNPDCPYCIAFKPEWDKLVGMTGNCLNAYAIDIKADPYFAEDRGTWVDKVPSVFFYPYGRYNSFEPYDGDKKAEAILNWVNQRLNFMGLCNPNELL